MRLRLPDRRLAGLGAALAASGALLLAPTTPRAPAGPVPVALAWPRAQAGSVPATLADGSAFKPLTFLDATTAIGSAPTPDGASVRLLRRGTDGSVLELRRLPAAQYPSFRNVTVSGSTLAWAEDTGNGGHLALWTTDLRDGRPARQITDLSGNPVLNEDAPDDLSIHDGRVSWIAPDPGRSGTVAVHSVALAGGAVDSRPQPGDWRQSAWPWLVDGATSPAGAGRLRNLVSGRDITIARPAGAQTRCSPTWCEAVSLSDDGSTNIVELMHPDGSSRTRISDGTAVPAIPEVAPLDRFEVLWRTDPNLDLTHSGELLLVEIATRRTVEVSPHAASVACRGGVLWWSNGDVTRPVTTWHTLDLRTI